LTPEGQLNPDIQPESGWNYEIGSRGRLLNQRLFYDIALYSMQIRNLLVARRTAEDAFVGINAGKTNHNGLELALSYTLYDRGEGSNIQLFTNYTYADYRFEEFVDGDRDFSGNDLTGVPRHSLSAGIDGQSKPGFYGNLNFQWISQIPILDDNSRFSEAYALTNLKVGYRQVLARRFHLDAFVGIQNLWDEAYASMLQINAVGFNAPPRYYYPGLPRNYFGGISLKYAFSIKK
ncbi:MAG: TonB-dependent receptor, partial [Bacteroidia bacterium]|nr:TonB-dependent receptor [Bacteroidia bacterium]